MDKTYDFRLTQTIISTAQTIYRTQYGLLFEFSVNAFIVFPFSEWLYFQFIYFTEFGKKKIFFKDLWTRWNDMSEKGRSFLE